MEREQLLKLKGLAEKDLGRLKTRANYYHAGIPNFPRLFGRDSLITAWQVLPINSAVARDTLKILAKFQGKVVDNAKDEEPGKILHEHFELGAFQYLGNFFQRLKKLSFDVDASRFAHWRFPYYASVDSTFLFLILLGEYYRETKDAALVKTLWPNVKRALYWAFKYGDCDEDGFIEYQRKNPYGLYHQGWKDGLEIDIAPPVAIVEVQGYAYAAYLHIAELAYRVIGDKQLARVLARKAHLLKKRFNQDFWMEPARNADSDAGGNEGFFALALDGNKKKVEIVTSNPGHLLFTGIIDDEKVSMVCNRLCQDDLWTDYGIRTHSSKDKYFDPMSYQRGSIWPHDNWMIAMGFEKLGFSERARMTEEGIFRACLELGYIPELFTVIDGKPVRIPQACTVQAWAAGAVANWVETQLLEFRREL